MRCDREHAAQVRSSELHLVPNVPSLRYLWRPCPNANCAARESNNRHSGDKTMVVPTTFKTALHQVIPTVKSCGFTLRRKLACLVQ